MSTRLDNELKQIAESISMLNNAQTPKTPKSQREIAKKAQAKEIIVLDAETDKFPPEPSSVINSGDPLRLNDPKGFEDRLMSRVKDALKAIID